MSQVNDPLDSADNPEIPATEYYGQAFVDSYYCVLVKGTGKVTFDPAAHTVDQRRTAITFQVQPLAEHNLSRPLSREYIAEFGAWPKITLPSIKALGVTVRQLGHAWCKVAVVPDGRTYEKNGETKESTTFKVLAVYPDEATCRAAYNGVTVTPQTAQAAPAAAPTNGNGNNAERTVAAKFIPTFVKSCDGDLERLGKVLAANPLVSKYFTATSPEVVQAVTDYEFAKLGKAA